MSEEDDEMSVLDKAIADSAGNTVVELPDRGGGQFDAIMSAGIEKHGEKAEEYADMMRLHRKPELIAFGMFSDREREYYLLRERTEMSREEIAEEMGLESANSLKGYDTRIANKKREAVELAEEF